MRTFALWMLIGCGGGEAPAAGGDDAKTEAPAPAGEADAKPDVAFSAPESLEAGMDICLGPVDCVAVQLSCCCGDDAVWIAVNKSRADEAKSTYGQKECGDCPAGECAAPETQCAGGCKIKG